MGGKRTLACTLLKVRGPAALGADVASGGRKSSRDKSALPIATNSAHPVVSGLGVDCESKQKGFS
jgi:hypothetical protein